VPVRDGEPADGVRLRSSESGGLARCMQRTFAGVLFRFYESACPIVPCGPHGEAVYQRGMEQRSVDAMGQVRGGKRERRE